MEMLLSILLVLLAPAIAAAIIGIVGLFTNITTPSPRRSYWVRWRTVGTGKRISFLGLRSFRRLPRFLRAGAVRVLLGTVVYCLTSQRGSVGAPPEINVANRHSYKNEGYGRYVGRGTALGNPFVIGPDGNRKQVIADYRDWLWHALKHGDRQVIPEFEKLYRLAVEKGRLDLVCSCAPKACHADVLKRALEARFHGKLKKPVMAPAPKVADGFSPRRALSNKVACPVYNVKGEKVASKREFDNTPWGEFFADVKFAILDCRGLKPAKVAKRLAELVIDGMKLAFWGSAVKAGKVVVAERDVGRETGVMHNVEDAAYGTRWMLVPGTFGGQVFDKGLKILVAANGEVFKHGHMVYDGCGFVARSVVEGGFIKGMRKIESRESLHSAQVWQRIPWTSIKKEAERIVSETYADAAASDLRMRRLATDHERSKLVALNAMMEVHPFVTAMVTRNDVKWLKSMVTTVPVPGNHWKVGVPSTVDRVTIAGRNAVYRYPLDSDGSLQAVDVKETSDVKAEAKRVARMEVVQGHLSSPNLFVKAIWCILPDDEFREVFGDVDIVVGEEDVKMASKMYGGKKGFKSQRIVHVEEKVVMPFVQWWAKGSAVGVNPEWAKEYLGADFDGDLFFFFPLDEYPQIFEAINTELRKAVSVKVNKGEKMPFPSAGDKRAEFAASCMTGLIGRVANLVSMSYAFEERDLALRAFNNRKWKDTDQMDDHFTWAYHVATDMMKKHMPRYVDHVDKLVKGCRDQFSEFAGAIPEWISWGKTRMGSNAFKRFVPMLRSELKPSTPREERDEALSDDVFDGTVAKIAELTLPVCRAVFGHKLTSRPLSFYINWAEQVEDGDIEDARKLYGHYCTYLENIQNISDDDAYYDGDGGEDASRLWARLDAIVQKKVYELAGDDPAARWTLANALWRVCHSATRNDDATAACVFRAFPEECERIVAERPGDVDGAGESFMLSGLHKQLPYAPDRFTMRAKVVEFDDVKQKGVTRRQALVGKYPSQKQPDLEFYPEDMIALVAFDQPACRFVDVEMEVDIQRVEGLTYVCSIAKVFGEENG